MTTARSNGLAQVASYLTIQEAAREAGVHPNTIRRWLLAHRVEGCRLGPKLMRVDGDSLEQVVQAL